LGQKVVGRQKVGFLFFGVFFNVYSSGTLSGLVKVFCENSVSYVMREEEAHLCFCNFMPCFWANRGMAESFFVSASSQLSSAHSVLVWHILSSRLFFLQISPRVAYPLAKLLVRKYEQN
jgi:hypothetical protein